MTHGSAGTDGHHGRDLPRMSFERGTVRIEDAGLIRIPHTAYEDKGRTLRAYGMHYSEITEYLQESGVGFVDGVPDLVPSQALRAVGQELRDYQRKAVQRWEESSRRGCVVLPTGAGKTAVGIKAIELVNAATLVVVPTIDLMGQWEGAISRYLSPVAGGGGGDPQDGMAVGRMGGGDDDVRAITVATYDSAYLRAPALGNRFKLVIFDEVHHLPAPGYRSIAEQLIAPYRLGLTATIEREDGLHEMIPRLVGGVVFQLGPQELSTRKHLAEYVIDRRQVSLTPEEQESYEASYAEFLTCFRRLGFKAPSMHNLRRMIMMSNANRTARCAMLARNKANEIAMNSRAKLDELRDILAENRGARTIIFTQNNKMVYEISDRFLIPLITYRTGREERRDVLDGFKSGRYGAVVTSRVLDEGVDVPDAELGVIMSGTGSGRELIQRLGRLLRPKHDGKKARLIELVSRRTRETGTSAKRIAALRKSGGGGATSQHGGGGAK